MTPRERLEQLLADHATDGLDPVELIELDRALADDPGVDPASWELAAAELHVAFIEASMSTEELPEHLRKSIVAQGRLSTRGNRASAGNRSGLGWLGYAAAVAAGVVLTLLFFLERPTDPVRGYQALLAKSDLDRATWTAVEGNGLEGISGEVIWSDEAQEGYLRLTGIPKNDPKKHQYQLWIVDPDRGEFNRVDGGVFDVPSDDGVQTIAIDAKIEVRDPTVFAITLENPGGAVVSLGPLRAVAQVQP